MGNPVGIQFQYYTQNLPAQAIGIAQVSTIPASPATLTDINNTVYAPAPLIATSYDVPLGPWAESIVYTVNTSILDSNGNVETVTAVAGTGTSGSVAPTWATATGEVTVDNPGANQVTWTMGINFTAGALGAFLAITGDTSYIVPNQFFELTDQTDTLGNPLFYQHPLPTGVSNIAVLDLLGNILPTTNYVIRTLTRGTNVITYILHSLPSGNNANDTFVAYQVRYVDAFGFLQTQILNFDNVIAYAPFTAGPANYTTQSLAVTVDSASTLFYIRWYAQNGYQVLPPYGTTPNDPWYIRVRFNLLPTPPEWATQVWTPQRPFILATWVPGTVLSTHIIQLERAPIYFKNGQYPDVLVYDQNYVLKYALAGKTGNGFLYPWQLNQFVDIDSNTGQVQIAVEVDPTDIVFGFYSYQETDVVFSSLDINPYTNPAIRNRLIQFYEKVNGEDLLHYIYYNILNSDGSSYATNDPSPTTGTNNFFGTVLVGQATSVGDFTFTDIRQRGGGLAPAYQDISEAVNFWDLGYWDGEPFPAGGSMIIYLPITVQDEFSTTEIANIIGGIVPMGSLPVIRYYDSEGNETVA